MRCLCLRTWTGAHTDQMPKTKNTDTANEFIIYVITSLLAITALYCRAVFERMSAETWAAQPKQDRKTRTPWPLCAHTVLTLRLANCSDAKTSLRNGRKAVGSGEAPKAPRGAIEAPPRHREPGVTRSLPFEKAPPGGVRAPPWAVSTPSAAPAAPAAPTAPGAPGGAFVQRGEAHLDGGEVEVCAPVR